MASNILSPLACTPHLPLQWAPRACPQHNRPSARDPARRGHGLPPPPDLRQVRKWKPWQAHRCHRSSDLAGPCNWPSLGRGVGAVHGEPSCKLKSRQRDGWNDGVHRALWSRERGPARPGWNSGRSQEALREGGLSWIPESEQVRASWAEGTAWTETGGKSQQGGCWLSRQTGWAGAQTPSQRPQGMFCPREIHHVHTKAGRGRAGG